MLQPTRSQQSQLLQTTSTALLPTNDSQNDSAATLEAQERRAWRVWLVASILALLCLLIIARLLAYQLFSDPNELFNTRLQLTQSPRGTIVDRDGEILAADRFYYQVVVTANAIKRAEDRQFVANELETLIALPAAKTWDILVQNADRPYAELAKKIEFDLGRQLIADIKTAMAENAATPLQYVAVRPIPQRFYPQDALASHIVGFVQADHYGIYGVEEFYDTFLQDDGVGLLVHNVSTIDSLQPKVRRFLPSVAGKDLILTIDRSIQYIIEEELQEAIAKYRAQSGSVIVMDPQTGGILGMANWPNYNPNTRNSENIDIARFLNPSVSALYEPGSIFKVITMAAGLDTGVITPTTPFTDTGFISLGHRTFYNSNRAAAGATNATEALARSLNVVTVQVADRVGSNDFYRYIRRFGFGERTGVDLADEVAGILKEPGDELWSLSDLGTNSFGQGLAVTPIQMINSVSAIANGGLLLRPYIVQSRIEDEHVLTTRPMLIQRVITPETAADLTEMMIATVEIGNKAARVPGYEIAGKSGTAQIPSPEGYLEDQTIASFIGFAPAHNPAFVLLVKLDRPDPAISQWASYSAAPVFSTIARRLFEHLNIAPDDVRNRVAMQSSTN